MSVNNQELRDMITAATLCGAHVSFRLEARALREDGREIVDAVRVRCGLPGVGPGEMAPISAMSRLSAAVPVRVDTAPDGRRRVRLISDVIVPELGPRTCAESSAETVEEAFAKAMRTARASTDPRDVAVVLWLDERRAAAGVKAAA